jgi:MFS transporter, DHA3 family, macrolide efflux protein
LHPADFRPADEAPPLLQQRPFRLLQYTRFTSRVAQNAVNFALVLLIVDETGKAFASALLVLALVIPGTVVGIVAGVAADHFPKRALIVFGDVARAIVALYFFREDVSVAGYYVVAVLLATFTQFSTSAEGAAMPVLVRKEQLARANAIKDAVGGASQVVGLAVLAPVLLRLLNSPDTLFLICAALWIVAAVQAVLIGRIPGHDRREIGGDRDPGSWWGAGWRAMRADQRVFHAAIELTLISTALIILAGLIPSYIEEVLGLPVDVGALVLLPAAVGIALGLRIAGFLAHRVPHAFLSTVGFTMFTVLLAAVTFVDREAEFLAGFSLFSWLDDIELGNFDGAGVLALMLMFPLGFAYAVVSVAAQTVINDLVPLHLQGRVGSTQAAMAALASSVPVLIAGALSDQLGVVPTMALICATIAVVAVAMLREPRSLRTEPVGV